MSDETETETVDKGRPWLLAVGAGLLVGGLAFAWYWGRRCDCAAQEGVESSSVGIPVREAIDRLRGVQNGKATGETGPPVGSWDDAAVRAWGVTPAGPQTLSSDAWVEATHDIADLDFEPTPE